MMPLMNVPTHDIADPVLYRLYFSLMMNDILHKLGMDATLENKVKLHEYHKKVLGYKTIAGVSQFILSQFLFEVCVLYAQMGIFVRTKANQPIDILDRPLKDVWHLL